VMECGGGETPSSLFGRDVGLGWDTATELAKQLRFTIIEALARGHILLSHNRQLMPLILAWHLLGLPALRNHMISPVSPDQ
jgi:hypothetical protein